MSSLCSRALFTRPKLLILDEPTEGIQPSIIKDIERVIRALVERGTMAEEKMIPLAAKPDDDAPYFAVVLVPGWNHRPGAEPGTELGGER